MLTAAKLKTIYSYDADTGLFTRIADCHNHAKIGDTVTNTNNRGYVAMFIEGRGYLGHRLAWLYTYGFFPKGQLDHINNIKTDNRLCNLREATGFENGWNIKRKINNTSGHKGVIYRKDTNKWRAVCMLNRVTHNLGSFINYEDAVAAYQEFSKKHHGEFCNLG